jgi:hypothetical protein
VAALAPFPRDERSGARAHAARGGACRAGAALPLRSFVVRKFHTVGPMGVDGEGKCLVEVGFLWRSAEPGGGWRTGETTQRRSKSATERRDAGAARARRSP